MTGISIVVPLLNEEDNVAGLHEEIVSACRESGFDFEIIFVDDGSTDGTMEKAANLSPLQYLKLRKNFGQTAAMDAGIKAAAKEYIVTMDGDRQNDPNDIVNLVKYLTENNLDVVSGWRRNRKDSFAKRFTSRGADLLRKLIIRDGIHDSGCSLKIYKKECFDRVSLYGEMHRFIPAVLKIQGFRVGEIVVNHRPRIAGVTKYNWKRTLKGFVDMIGVWYWNRYSVRPLHLLGSLGLFLLLGGVFTGGLTIWEFYQGRSLSDTVLPLLTAFFIISGIQTFLFGLMSDMLSKTYFETSHGAAYSIEKITRNGGEEARESE